MGICPSCGVEVEPDLAACPLCRAPLQPAARADHQPAQEQPRDEPGPSPALRRWLLEAVTLLAGAGAIVVFAADFAYKMVLTWSPYPLAGIGFLWLSAIAAILLRRRPVVWLVSQTCALLVFLYGLDVLTGGRPWFMELALPAAVLAVVLAAACVALVRSRVRAPLPATAVALVAVGLYLFGLEQILNRWASRAPAPGWSLVALGCILALALVLLFLHRWVRSHPELRRLFHV